MTSSAPLETGVRHPFVMLLAMGRHLRIDFEGAWHHVMHRGAGRRTVFRDDEERRIFLRLVGELEERFGLEVHAYVLMGNHFHLLVRSAEGRLSAAMQWLLSNFTRWVNTRRGVDGAIFRGRFHAVGVESEKHRYLLFRYLAENPLDLGIEVDPVTYEWSSLAVVHAGRSPVWLRTELMKELFGADAAGLANELRTRVRGSGAPKRPALPDEALESAVELAHAAAEGAVGFAGSIEREALRISAALWIVDSAGRWSREQVARAFGTNTSAVGTSLYRLRRSMDRDPSTRRYVARAAELVAVDSVTLGV